MRRRSQYSMSYWVRCGSMLLALGCTKPSNDQQTTRKVAQVLVSQPRFVGPADLPMERVLVSGTERFHLYDRVKIGQGGFTASMVAEAT